jgi:Putative Ig domain/Secretion system C-terminal sorting domain
MKKSLLFFIISFVLIMSSATVMAANATLNGLTINAGTLTPGFTFNNFAYAVQVSDVTTTIKVTPTQTLVGSTIKVNGTVVASGALSGAIALVPGTNTITIVVTKAGNTTETYTIVVTKEDISYGTPLTYYTGTPITTLVSTETGDNPTSYSAVLPAGLTINLVTGDITGTPTAVSAAANYTVTSNYGGGITATATINITVLAPTISYTGSPFTYYTGTAITTLTSTEIGGNPTSYSGALPAGLSLNNATGDITGTPATTSAATPYTITAHYGAGITATATINITVLAPTISYAGSPYTYTTGVAIAPLTPTVTGSPTSYSIVPALSAGLTFTPATGVLSGTPTVTSAATTYTITAIYTLGVTATTTVIMRVFPPAPVISYTPSINVYTINSAIASLTPANTGGAAVSYSISTPLPAGLTFSTTTGVISGTPTVLSLITTYTITAVNTGGTGSTTVTITVNPPVPVISYTPSTNIYVVGNAIPTLTPVNTGGAPTSYSISTPLPTGMAFSTTTGVISGTPLLASATTTYTINAINAGGTGSTTVTLKVDLFPPAISYTPSTNIYMVGIAIAALSPTIITGTPSSYSITPALPAGLTFNAVTGVISGTPTALSALITYTVTASNAGGNGNTTVKISCVNPPAPIISYVPSTNTYTTGIAITSLTPTNTGGAAVGGYTISTPLPIGLTFNTVTGVISGTPTVVSLTTTYTITATNAGGSGSTTVTITVNPPAPVISYTPSTNIYSNGTAITPLSPANTGGAAVSYSISAPLPTGLLFSTTTGIISGTPTATSTATTYTITATNAGGNGSTTVNLTVNPLPPVISYTPSANIYTVNTAITPLPPTNTGGAAVSYSIGPALPAGLSLNTITGVISGTPTAISLLTTYTITATNPGGSGSTTVTITVNPAPPVISYTPSTSIYTVGAAASQTPINTGGASTSYVIGPALPAGLTFNTTTGVISGIPTAISPGTTYTISADNAGGVGTTTITLSCVNPLSPVISYTPSTNIYTVGTAITALTPANTGGAATGYSINTALPAGLSFNIATGTISGTPTAVSPATTYTITAINAAGSGTTTVTLTVNPQGPVISYTPSTNIYTVGTPITALTPANTGGAAASYSISTALPAGLVFNTITGAISGNPTALSAVTTYTITAINAGGSGSTTITLSVNHIPPVVSYTPSTITYSAGTTITPFAPTTITGGAPVSYSVNIAMPAGLSFDTTTGIISGTPTAVFPTATFTITATNTAGTGTTNLIITVSPHAPIISYTPSTNNYPVGAAITTLSPTNTGGAVTGYSYSGIGTPLTGAALSGPSLMTIDAAGNIYVADYNSGKISKYNSAGTYIGTFGSGIAFTNPCGLVFDSAGNCYVMDTGSGSVYKLNPAGVYQSTIIGGLGHPLGISIDASNNLYIATYNTGTGANQVKEYNTAGTTLLTVSTTGMNYSDGVAVDPVGNIYVLNRTGNNVTKYNSLGVYVGVFASGYNGPLAISTDPSGNVFVGDSHNNQIKIYNPAGILLNTITGFNDVEGFVADASGNLYVSDYTNNTVKEFAALGGYHISGALPPGLSFNSTNGQITGTPTSVFPATNYTVTAYNVTGGGSTNITLSCYSSYDWVGTTSTDWNTPTNWLSGVVPTAANQAIIGVNRAFTNFPNILTASGTVNIGSIAFGNLGGQASGVAINTGSILNVAGAITYQSDASSGLGYTCTLSGGGTLNTNSISVISNTTLASSYTQTLASSVANLNITTNISLTSTNLGGALFNSAFNLTGGTALLTGILQTNNSAASTSSFVVIPATTATLQLPNITALSGLSATGTNIVTFNNIGATVEYSGANQVIYTSASTTGLPAGVSYQNISFSGTGAKTAFSGNLNITGDITNNLLNNAGNYLDLSAPTINFNGTSQNFAAGPGNGTTFTNVTFSGAGTKTMTSGQFYIASSGVLTMSGNSPSTILATGGLLTLNSDVNGSASVAAIPTGPSITGNVNVQRYITGGAWYRGYRLGSSPIYNATIAPNNVYGINYLQNNMYLTGTVGGGFDKVGNPTLYLYREDLIPSNTTFVSGNFWGISAINNTPSYNYFMNGGATAYNIPVGNGFLFFFRGNKASALVGVETTPGYTPVTVTTTTSGTLNQGQIIVHDWYTPGSSNLGYTGAGIGTNFSVRGFNLVGNPYASSIDWEQFNASTPTSGIYGNNVGITTYLLDPATSNYDIYQKGGAYTNHGRRTIVSGQGFFVLAANNTNPQLIFNESAKSTTQNTGFNLLMTDKASIADLINANIDQHLRLQMVMDSINTDDIYIGFKSTASTQFANDEDAPFKQGNGKISLSSISSDNIPLAINRLPLPGLKQLIIPLSVAARANGTYKLNMTELDAVPQLYEVWLMDRYKKDSLDMRKNTTYAFDITADTNSYGSKRFQLVLRQNLALAMHLINFTATKALNGAQTTWVTENEQNYTNFTVERSTDGGVTFKVLGGFASNALGTYNFVDNAPPLATDMYRLKVEDLNNTISYSNIVTLIYGNANSLPKNNISLYPNPTKSTLNLTITPTINLNSNSGSVINSTANTVNAVYNIKIVNASGLIIKTATTTQKDWQTNVSNLKPGTYIIEVDNNSNSSLVGKGAFVKL